MDLKQHVPEGVVDILEQECSLKRRIEGKIASVFASFGYHEIETPTYEFYDVFEGEIGQEKLIKFFDEKGRILTLRSDITTPIARIAATKYKNPPLPLRLCYVGNAFRGGETFKGARQHEFTQAGIELIGVNSPEADSEVIAATIRSLLKAGLKDFLIELGQADFFKGLAESAGLSGEDREVLRGLVDRKDRLGISDFVASLSISDEERALFEKMPQLYGDIDVLEQVDTAGLNPTSRRAIQNIKEVYSILKDYGFEQYISVDLGMVHALDYYTGMIFKGVTKFLGMSVCGGGRYDHLIEKFGPSMPATGVAIGIDRVMSAIQRQNGELPEIKTDALVRYQPTSRKTAFEIADHLRQKGVVTELAVGPEDEAYLQAKGIGRVITCGDEITVTEGGKTRMLEDWREQL